MSVQAPTAPVQQEKLVRRRPIGAEVLPSGGVHFRVWAPRAAQVEVVLIESRTKEESYFDLAPEPNGYHSGTVDRCASGSLYGFRLNKEGRWYPDPLSRFQPQGPHGPSQVIDPQSFAWTDDAWPGVRLHGQVMYEMHVGTFTPQG